MKTKRSNRRNKNRKTMKGGGDDSRTLLTQGVFWKKEHGPSYDWKKRKYYLYKVEGQNKKYQLEYYHGKKKKGIIIFESDNDNVITETDGNNLDIPMSFLGDLTEKTNRSDLQTKILDTRKINITDIKEKVYPIFFETEVDYNNFMNIINTNGGRARTGRKTRKYKRKTRRRKNKKRKSRTRSIRRQ